MKIQPTTKIKVAMIYVSGLTWCITLIAAQPPEEVELKQFWSTFRNAVLQRDWKKLDNMTSFPLIVRGELDRDPVRRVERNEFSSVFDRFLKEGVFSPNEQLQLIRKTTTIKAAANSGGICRVGDMLFRRTGQGWRLYALYMQYSLD